MLVNLHTHTNLCDGNNTPEEMVLSAIDKGFDVLGFAGHGYTDHDLSYCMKDMDEYITIISMLKEKYKDKIQIYTGVEEDVTFLHNRKNYDYILGSNHYVIKDGKFYSIDHKKENFPQLLKLFDNDSLKLAENYYELLIDYVKKRKPDIIGHFDLITKYDETELGCYFNNEKYHKMAAKYLKEVIPCGCIFEVNSGAISRGYRTSVYPYENLLHILCKNDGKIILSSDCHSADTIDFYFKEMTYMLKNIGFKDRYVFYNNEFVKVSL